MTRIFIRIRYGQGEFGVPLLISSVVEYDVDYYHGEFLLFVGIIEFIHLWMNFVETSCCHAMHSIQHSVTLQYPHA